MSIFMSRQGDNLYCKAAGPVYIEAGIIYMYPKKEFSKAKTLITRHNNWKNET